jgi:hypothetical protein
MSKQPIPQSHPAELRVSVDGQTNSRHPNAPAPDRKITISAVLVMLRLSASLPYMTDLLVLAGK